MAWLKINSVKANSGNFQFMVLGANKNDCFNLNVAGKVIPSSSEAKLLGIRTDYKLEFKKHINELCRKASYKLHALQRIRRYFYQLTKQGYLLMYLLTVNLIMCL